MPGNRNRSHVPPIASRPSRIANVCPGRRARRCAAPPMPEIPAPTIRTSKSGGEPSILWSCPCSHRKRPRINSVTVGTPLRDVALLSLTASLNPTLLTVTTIMLMLDRPKGLMLGYLLGAYVTSITLGCIIVFSLSNSSAADTTQHTLSPLADIGLGLLALIAAFVIGRDRSERPKKEKGPPRWQR